MTVPIQGGRFLSHFCDRPFVRLALLGALAAAFALAGCGRKGPLDPPPASLAGEKTAPAGNAATADNPGVGANSQPTAPKDSNKRIFLDGLLN